MRYIVIASIVLFSTFILVMFCALAKTAGDADRELEKLHRDFLLRKGEVDYGADW